MATQISPLLQNEIVNAITYYFPSGSLLIYDASANLLVTIPLGSPAFESASAGIAHKAGTWSATISASGGAASFKLVDAIGSTYGTGTCGEGTGDLSFDNATFVEGGIATISDFTITQPAS